MSIIKIMIIGGGIKKMGTEEIEDIKDEMAEMAERMIDGLINGSPYHSEVDSTLEELWGQPEDAIEQIAQYNTSSIN